MILNIDENSRPLCPNSSNFPTNEAHNARNRFLDALYDLVPKDKEGEIEEPFSDIYYKLAYEKISDKMHLFTTGSQIDTFSSAESYWYKCLICGFILPAYRKPPR